MRTTPRTRRHAKDCPGPERLLGQNVAVPAVVKRQRDEENSREPLAGRARCGSVRNDIRTDRRAERARAACPQWHCCSSGGASVQCIAKRRGTGQSANGSGHGRDPADGGQRSHACSYPERTRSRRAAVGRSLQRPVPRPQAGAASLPAAVASQSAAAVSAAAYPQRGLCVSHEDAPNSDNAFAQPIARRVARDPAPHTRRCRGCARADRCAARSFRSALRSHRESRPDRACRRGIVASYADQRNSSRDADRRVASSRGRDRRARSGDAISRRADGRAASNGAGRARDDRGADARRSGYRPRTWNAFAPAASGQGVDAGLVAVRRNRRTS